MKFVRLARLMVDDASANELGVELHAEQEIAGLADKAHMRDQLALRAVV